MGERQVIEIAERLKRHHDESPDQDPRVALREIPGTVEVRPASDLQEKGVLLSSFEEVADSPENFLRFAIALEKAVVSRPPSSEHQADFGLAILQAHGNRTVIEWPPHPLSPRELDDIYALPFRRKAHPSYPDGIPALAAVQFSVVTHRGCFGGCTFCALALHQGKHVVSRNEDAVLTEIQNLTRHPDFRGTVPDVGGPSANMYGMEGKDRSTCDTCRRASCLFPDLCPNLNVSHERQVRLLRRALDTPQVRHLFIASGIRYDLLLPRENSGMCPDAQEYFRLLVGRLVGGHLSVAPEHASEKVLRLMRKPSYERYERFLRLFQEESTRAGKEQYLIPYFIASFPGSTEADMQEVACHLREEGRKPQQIQDFLPGPMTLAAAMYYAEREPRQFQPIPVAKEARQRRRQREILLGAPTSAARTSTYSRSKPGPRPFSPASKHKPRPSSPTPRKRSRRSHKT
ncbi:DUF3362 domain-containing protein, partial [bacterium]|nr:DUF3362 domain-containing protein [bacterium]